MQGESMNERQSSCAAVDRLIKLIVMKLEANKPVLAKSLGHGRVTWRKQGNGEIEIDLEPKL
jgi:hypothetical protein